MVCPVCDAEAIESHTSCPRCGAPWQVGTLRRVEIVESTAEWGPVSAELPSPPEPRAVATASGSRPRDTRLAVAAPSLPAVLWQQPVVRAVARTGAGALALALGMHLVRAWLARPQTVPALARSALPMLAEQIWQDGRSGRYPGERVERGMEVVETVILVQRVTRRR